MPKRDDFNFFPPEAWQGPSPAFCSSSKLLEDLRPPEAAALIFSFFLFLLLFFFSFFFLLRPWAARLDCPARKSDKKVKGVKKACRGNSVVNERTRPPPRGATPLAETTTGRGRPCRLGGPDDLLPILRDFPRTSEKIVRRRKSETGPGGHFPLILYTGRPSLGVSLFLRGEIFSEVQGKPHGFPVLRPLAGRTHFEARRRRTPWRGRHPDEICPPSRHHFFTTFTFLSLFLAGLSRSILDETPAKPN